MDNRVTFKNFEPVLGINPENVAISNSEIQTFKRCRRRWLLGTYYGLGPKEETITGPLPLGTRIHDALELFYRDGTNPVNTYNILFRKDSEKFALTTAAQDEAEVKKFNSEGELGRIMLEGYLDWLEDTGVDSDIEFYSEEEQLRYRLTGIDDRVEIIAKIDARVRKRSDGTKYTLDHKALHIDQKILTPTGYKRIGDAQIGDELLAPDGTITRITGVYPQGTVPLLSVEFSDHTSVLTCNDHLWSVKSINKNDYEVLNTGQLSRDLRYRNRFKYSIPKITGDFDFVQDSDLPIDPYVLGCIIGDGGVASSKVVISSADTELIDIVKSHMGDSVIIRKPSYSKYDYILNDKYIEQVVGADGTLFKRYPLVESLKTLGLLGKKSFEKSVPNEYLYSSRDTRLEVLRGIMDTDGFVRPSGTQNGSVGLHTTSQQLAKDVAWLVRSLGGTATIGSPKMGKYRTKAGNIKETRNFWHVSISLDSSLVPFKLSRKVEVYNSRVRTSTKKMIVSITEAGSGDAVCISVDHPDSLYITDDFIVTHNTAAASGFGDYLKYANYSEQLRHYTLLERILEPDLKLDGGIYNILKKVKRTGTAKPPFYERIETRFNKKDIESFWYRLLGTVRDIMNVRDALDAGEDDRFVAYPTQKMDWSCGTCPFFQMCPMMDDGSDYEAYAEDHFHQHDPNARYNETKDEGDLNG